MEKLVLCILMTNSLKFVYNVFVVVSSSTTYDGGQDAILNMGTYLVSHEVLRDYMYHYMQSG